MLKLNADNTEVMLFKSKQNSRLISNVSVKVGDSVITSTESVKNLGTTLPALGRLDPGFARLKGRACTD